MTNDADATSPKKPAERLLTVARVRILSDHADVMFFESARIYRLLPTNPVYASALQILREASADGSPVRVRLLKKHGEVIETVSSDS